MDTVWLDFDYPFLRDTGRATEVLHELETGGRQPPQFLHFVGGTLKRRVLDKIYPCFTHTNNILPTLQIDPSRADWACPLILADSDPSGVGGSLDAKSQKAAQGYNVCWLAPSSVQSFHDEVNARVVRCFTDVICIFVDDVGDEVSTLNLLWRWVGAFHSRTRRSLPQVILVQCNGAGKRDSTMYPTTDLPNGVDDRTWSLLREFYRSITWINISGNQIASTASIWSLKLLIDRKLKSAFDERALHGEAYRPRHISHLLRKSVELTCAAASGPLDIMRESRCENPVNPDLSVQVRRFLLLGLKHGSFWQGLLRHVALCLTVDAFPPEMHDFMPQHVFDRLYRSSCEDAVASVQALDKTLSMALLKQTFVGLGDQLHNRSAVALFQMMVQRQPISWSLMFSDQDCLACLQRKPVPSLRLECGHALCSVCFSHHGHQLPGLEGRHRVAKCPLCLGQGHTAVLQPANTGQRVLVIDGGGVRGIMTVVMAERLQRMMGGRYPLQDFFDLIVGTSVGGIIALMLVQQRANVATCSELVKDICMKLFGTPWREKGFVAWLTQLVKSLTKDALYDVKPLEQWLEREFGDQLISHRPRYELTPNLAITTASVEAPPKLVLMTNFNLPSSHADLSINIVQPSSGIEIKSVEVARSTSAAPIYFEMACPEQLGYHLQDGGAIGPPTEIALDVVEAALRTSGQRPEMPDWHPCDILLSLGTGCKIATPPRKSMGYPDLSQKGWPIRALEAVDAQFDGDAAFLRCQLRMNGKPSFRLNPRVPRLPQLDEVTSMDALRQQTMADTSLEPELRQAVLGMIAANLFLALDGEPRASPSGSLNCKVLLRWRAAPGLINQLTSDTDDFRIRFSQSQPVEISQSLRWRHDRICARCGLWSLPLELSVASGTQSFKLSIVHNVGPKTLEYVLGGMPTTVERMRRAQGMSTVWGSAIHIHPSTCASCRHR